MNELLPYDNLRRVLEEYAEQAKEIYKYQIALGAHNASRDLTDNVKSHVVVGETAYEVTLDLNYYWKFLEGGSKGTISSPMGAEFPAHFPPPWAIEKWINVKPIIPKPIILKSGKSRIPSPKQLSYAIATNIEKYGQEPFPALATTKEELEKMFKDKIAEAMAEDVRILMEKFLLKEG